MYMGGGARVYASGRFGTAWVRGWRGRRASLRVGVGAGAWAEP